MATLSHQAYASPNVPIWLSATDAPNIQSPLTVLDNLTTPNREVVITTGTYAGSIVYSSNTGANPIGISFNRGVTQPQNNISFDVGNVTPVVFMNALNTTFNTNMILDTPVNAENLLISQISNGSVLSQGTGGIITLFNSATPSVRIMNNTVCCNSGVINLFDAANASNATVLAPTIVQMGNVSGGVAGVGVTGTSAFLGATKNVPNTATAGVIVDSNNSCKLQFSDGVGDIGTISEVGSSIVISNNSYAAVTVSNNGVVEIPLLKGNIPIGGIIMWSGTVASIPANWNLCDGTNGTPDLRDKFVLGLGSTPAYTTPSGGSTNINISNLPAHAHNINDMQHNHTLYTASSFDTFGRTGGSTNFAKDGATLTTSSSYTGITKTTVGLIDTASNSVTPNSAPYLPPYSILHLSCELLNYHYLQFYYGIHHHSMYQLQ